MNQHIEHLGKRERNLQNDRRTAKELLNHPDYQPPFCARCGRLVPNTSKDAEAVIRAQCNQVLAHHFTRNAKSRKDAERTCPDCGTPLKPRKLYCPDCAEKRRREQTKNRVRRHRRKKHVPM